MQKKIEVRYLPLFYDDLLKIVNYISNILGNNVAATKLLNEIENAINKRIPIADSFATFKSKYNRGNSYYKISVGNYYIFYVILDNGNTSIVEFRRIIYNKRNWQSMLD